MAIVVDTCSLVMIAKNYLPLDKDGCLFTFLEDAFYKRELLLLDAILEETKLLQLQNTCIEKDSLLTNSITIIPTSEPVSM